MLRKLLLLFVLSFSYLLNAQTLYWVGGSGNMNDRNHWSLTSGGTSANVVPGPSSDLVFDNNSSSGNFIINIVGLNYAKSLECLNTTTDLHFTGDGFSNVTCAGDFIFNRRTFYEANSKLIFQNPTSTVNTVNFFGNVIQADVLFENASWNLQSIKVGDNYTLKFNKGTYNVNNTSIVAGNLEATTDPVTFNSTHSTFHIKNRIFLGQDVSFNSTDLVLIANSTNSALYHVNSGVSMGSNARVVNPSPQACTIGYAFTNPTCNNVCNGSITVTFAAGCNTGPYDLIFNTLATCVPSGTNGISPPTLTLPGLCGCAGNLLDIYVFDGSGFVTSLTSLNMPAIPPPINIVFTAPKEPNCFGQCNGSVNISLTGGFAPYSVSVDPSLPGVTFTANPFVTNPVINLCAGIHTFSVTDNNGCARTFTSTTTQPAVLLPNGIANSVTCNGACNGAANLSPTGGTSPYTYAWIPAAGSPTANSVSGLCPGVVTATVTDSRTCTATFSATIVQPPPITLTVTKTNLICGALCDGTASITATGGTNVGFTYTWTPNVSTTSSAVGLCVGNYTVDVRDNQSCLKTVTFAITAPPTLTATPTQTNVLCSGACNGIISSNPSGGTGAYTFSWTPAAGTNSVISGLCAGAYSFTVTDAVGCVISKTLSITQPPPATLTITKTDLACNGVCNGTAIGNISGGTGPYTFTWSPGSPTGQGTATISALCQGTYTLNVKDANLCLSTATVNITQPPPITANITMTQPTCNGLCNGSINATTSGGSGVYTYTLQPAVGAPIISSPPFNGLCAGSYSLIVTDNLGCTITQTISLTQPNAIIITLNTTPINCFNICNASLSTVVNGGTPAYTFTWSTGSNTSAITNQCVGLYTVTVSDFFGCQATASVNITSPSDMTVSITPTNPNCDAQCTGVATATVSGGTPNYTYNWNNGNPSNINSNLCAGVYTLTVHDFFGCVKLQTVSIITPPAITLTPVNGTVSCSGACNGTVSVNPTGGTPGYFYSWNSLPAQSTQVASGLCVGNYIASVTDSKGCIAFTSASVVQPPVLTATITNIQSSCNVCIGSATANGIGGTAPYTFVWSNSQTTGTATNLCVGVHTVTVTDASGCVATETVNIAQTVIVLVTSNGNTLTCNGGCTGIATANASGGTGSYSYTWTPTMQSTQTATGLCAGTHTVVVADANGCSNVDQVTFINPPVLTLNVTKTDVTCNGACDGTGSASASGGTGAISYLWQPGNFTSANIGSLCPGSYTVIASDANNCSQTQIITITQSNSLTATFSFTNPSSCPSSDGAISFVASGGVGPYTFTWTPGTPVNPLINLPDGTYVLTLRDVNGCLRSFTTTLSDPAGPTVTVNSNSIACFGLCTGSASLSITGTGPFAVSWPGVPSTNTVVSGLCAGNYVAQVTDANVCVTNQTVNIVQPALLTSSGIVTNATCNSICSASINITPTGGTPGYTYTWAPSGGSVQDPVNLCANNYSVTITDANSCITTNTFVITQPTPLTLSFNKKDVLCNGNCTGSVRAVVGGATLPYTYTWTPSGSFGGSNLDTIINLCTGIYTVTASDASGCTITGTVNIGQPALLTSTLTSINNLCNGQCNGTATLTPAGGTAPYNYSYNTGPVTTTSVVSGLCSGSYNGIVTDANGCTNQHPFTITEPLPIVVTSTVTNPLCNAACNGSITTSVTGGTPNYTYSWLTAGGTSQNPTGLCAGNYTVTVTDINSCTGVGLATLVNPPSLIANTSFTNPVCGGGCSGIVTANPIGGTGPFTYQWASPISNNQTVTGLCAGSYTVTVTDANSCQNMQTVNLVAPVTVAVNPAVTPASCGTSNGSINASASSGNPPFTYHWLPPVPAAQSTFTVVTGLGAGIYTVVVTDASACSLTVTIPLSNSNGPSSATISFTDVACNAQCNGAASITNPVGGTAPYTISWVNPAATGSLITNLCQGSYTAQIVDANNCVLFQSVTIAQPQTMDDNEVLNSSSCFGNCNGAIALNPSGGNGGYTYSWSNSATTSNVSSLCPGNYSVTITDSKNCTFTANYNLPALTTITSSTFVTNNACFQNCAGTALATNVAGGLPPYSFQWSDPLGQSNIQAVGLCNGSYSITITDANGCFSTIPATISSPSPVTFTPNITQPSCNMCNGSASVTPTGGTPTYSLVWSNSQTGSNISNLCAGIYMVKITDGNGCVSNTNVVINSSSGITSHSVTQSNVSCAGVCDGSVTVTAIGGVAPITYNWVHNNSPSQSLTGLCAGTYYCNMTDANGCSRTASVVINSASTLFFLSQVTQSSCTSSTGSITVNVLGGNGTYTYAWLPAGNTATLTNLAPGSYTLTVTDGLGCSKTQVYSIGSINGPAITFTKKDVTCATTCNGNIAISITGGTPAYSVLWSNSATTNTITNLCAGAYSVEVTDVAGCKAVQNFSLNTVSPIIFSAPDSHSPKCHNDCNGSLTAIPIGGSLPYIFTWTPGPVNGPTTNSLCAGNYSINVVDANGCAASQSYSLTNPTVLALTSTVTQASCNNATDGSIGLTVTGGTPSYTYSWTPGSATTSSLTNVLPGTYTLTLIDGGGTGCRKDTVFVINPAITVNALAGNDTTFCQNGSLQLNGSNSNGGITYQWFELPSNIAISNTLITTVTPATGTNTFVLIATNGACIDSDTIVVTSNPLPFVDAGPFVDIPIFSTSVIGGNPTAPAGSTFAWSPASGLDNPTISNPVSSTTVTTIYTVSIVDANGCTNSDTVTVFVYPEIKIPNGFSPNGDGKNDVWQLDMIYLFPNNEVEVYNRWGELLFYSKGYPIPFNGQYKGQNLPVGTYYYVIKLNHPSYPNAYTGPLTIFR
ncbi:MAG: gliding motility-associated C-terminal domain-containing protein [Bacteroidota bacterium]